MEQVTANVYAETRVRGCNPGYVVTGGGVVVIDTPQLPTHAVRMRAEAEARGPIRYLINTEHHIDHIFGNYFFKGAGTVVAHEEVDRNFMVVTPAIDPFAYAKEAIPTHDPAGAALFPERSVYFANPNKPTITFRGDVTLRLGDRTFALLHTPGHSPGQIAVHIPEERVLFTGDTIFNGCQTWVNEADPDQWLASLRRLEALDVDHVVPGHGPVCTRSCFRVQEAFLREWVTAVACGIAKGWTKDECMERISFLDRFPVDVGQEYMGPKVQRINVARLYDYLTAR